MSPGHYVALAVILFVIGAVGVLVRRNAMVVFMCVELMLNAVNLAFVAFARLHGTLDGQVIAFFVMVVAAAEVVVGLAILTAIFRTRRSASVDDPNLVLDTIKRGERSGALVLRLYEAHGGRGVARVQLAVPVQRVRLATALEDEAGDVELEDGVLVLPYRPHEVLTVLVEQAKEI